MFNRNRFCLLAGGVCLWGQLALAQVPITQQSRPATQGARPATQGARPATQWVSGSEIWVQGDIVQSPEMPDRIRHLRIAAENLRQAGFEKSFHELQAKADQMEQEFSSQHLKGLPAALITELRELRASVQELRAEVHQLRHQLQAQAPEEKEGSDIEKEAHIRLPDREDRIPDEALDAAPRERPIFDRTPARATVSPRWESGDVEFELVPVAPLEKRSRSKPIPPRDEPVPEPESLEK